MFDSQTPAVPAVSSTPTVSSARTSAPVPLNPSGSVSPPSAPAISSESQPEQRSAPVRPTTISPAAGVSRPLKDSSENAARMTSMPEAFYLPPKRPTLASRVVVALSVAVLVGAIMWGAGVLLSDRIDIGLPFFSFHRKKPQVQQPPPGAPEQVPISAPTTSVSPAPPASVEAPTTTLPGPLTSGGSVLPAPLTNGVATEQTSTQTPPANGTAENPSVPPASAVQRVNASVDTDADMLTDEEEKIYQTSPVNPDSDGDSFKDGDEVRNLYNPNKGNGAKLEDSGLATRYTNPVVRYTLLYPKPWTVKATDNTAQEVIFTADTGEFVSVLVQSNEQQQSILDWYKQQNPSADASTLVEVKTLGGLSGVESPDGLTTYIAVGKSVIVFAYNIGLRPDANFFASVAMMRNSLTAPK